ncbi:M28 family peptidase [Roseovarius sp. 2305UL8-3]|uniref:M28 family peptidase n=1 Tax=Roseovarius conchicola TaxID=3121636 RepID=UPI003529D15D
MTQFRPDVSIENVMTHVTHMQQHFPNRKSGDGQDLEAARYVVERMKDYGLRAELQPFETYDSDIGTSCVKLGGIDGEDIASLPCLHVEPTPDAGLTVELVDVGPGGTEDYEGKDVRGKIVLAEVSYAPATPEKARIAAANGAAAILLMNWGRDNSTEIPWRGLKSVWGNPTPESVVEMPLIPGVSISRADGLRLRGLMAEGTVTLYLRLTAHREWRRLHQPVAWLDAPETAPQRDQFMVVSAHVDSWNPGVTDNIAGMSVILEMARAFAAQKDKLTRSAVFCCWNGHEVAEAAGSTWFVDSHWEKINRDAVGYLNVDSVGMRNTSVFHVNCSPELQALAHAVTDEVYAERLPRSVTPLRRVGDQSFFGVGVPAITGRHMFSAEVIREHNGATLGWYNHTGFDTLEEVDPAALAGDLEWNSAALSCFLTEQTLPYRFADRLADMKIRFESALTNSTQKSGLEVVFFDIARLEPEIAWLDSVLMQTDLPTAPRLIADRAARRIARQLTFLTSAALGKYGQDSYGSSTLLQPVPLLACLAEYEATTPGSMEERLLWTKLIQLRHQLTDAFELAHNAAVDARNLFATVENGETEDG